MSGPREIVLEQLELPEFVRPGDGVVWGQLTGEPLPVSCRLMQQRHAIGAFSVFLGAPASDTCRPEHADVVTFRGIGGIGQSRALAKGGMLEIVPAHISMMPRYIGQGLIKCDVAIVQATQDQDGALSYAVASDYIVAAVAKARVVIAEVNVTAPRTAGPAPIPTDKLGCIVRTERPVIAVPAMRRGDVELAIAAIAAEFIPDGAVLQVGIGAVPDSILSHLSDRRDLGIHSGMIGDSVVDLVERGAVTNATKPFDRGLITTGMLAGTDRLYRFCDRNPLLSMRTVADTHGASIVAAIPKLISINSAIEVDITGQVNAEAAGGAHIGAVGGAVDFVRGANLSPGGRSIIALPSTTADGGISRIVGRLAGPVSTSRSDVDVIVTEYGAAELRGRSLRERASALIAIAHPNFQDGLDRAMHAQRMLT